MRSFPMVSASSIGASVRFVAKHAGFEGVEIVLRRARLPLEMAGATQQDGRFIPLRSLFLVLEAASEAVKVRDFGVALVQQRGFSSVGSLFRDAERSADLGTAVEAACQASKSYSNHVHLEVVRSGEFRRIGLATNLGASRGARQLTDLLLAALVSLVRRFAGSAWRPVSIEADYASGLGDGAGLANFAERALVYGQPAAALVIDDAAWRSRSVRIDAAQPPLHHPVPPNDLTSVVRELIRLCLLDTECSLLVIARTMGVSARTLQRELNAAGCTFRRLVVAERCARAAELLVETRSAIGDIALSSGYSSHNHLARAFKSLDLVSPGQYRSRMGKTKALEPIKARSANRPP